MLGVSETSSNHFYESATRRIVLSIGLFASRAKPIVALAGCSKSRRLKPENASNFRPVVSSILAAVLHGPRRRYKSRPASQETQ